jgi:imidazolonepropionase-like amidohydrolase
VIEVGARADLVVFAGDPLEDISHILDPELVMKDGELATSASGT